MQLKWLLCSAGVIVLLSLVLWQTAILPAPHKLLNDAAVDDSSAREKHLREVIEKLAPIQEKLGPPKSGDWLTEHREITQSFDSYLTSNPTTAWGKRRVIDIVPIGRFEGLSKKILRQTVEFIGLYYQLEVRLHPEYPLSQIPAKARRVHPSWGDRQILTRYLLDEILIKKLSDDSAAIIGLTTSDLWPGQGWNFVFGEAYLRKRAGIWSIYRNGDPKKEYALFLRRTLKTATHELGHIFSIHHETRFRCNMCGSNHLEEADGHPLWLCHESLAKLAYATGSDVQKRYTQLQDWTLTNGLESEAAFYEKASTLLQPLK